MAQVVINPQAQLEIYAIWGYINQDNPSAVDRWIDSINDRCATLALHPKLGPARDDLRPEMRYFPVGRYLILYREIADGVEIVRVLHGARNIEAIFHGDE